MAENLTGPTVIERFKKHIGRAVVAIGTAATAIVGVSPSTAAAAETGGLLRYRL